MYIQDCGLINEHYNEDVFGNKSTNFCNRLNIVEVLHRIWCNKELGAEPSSKNPGFVISKDLVEIERLIKRHYRLCRIIH